MSALDPTAAVRDSAPLAAHLQGEHASLGEPLARLLASLADAGRSLARELARAAFTGRHGDTDERNRHGDRVTRLDAWVNQYLVDALTAGGGVGVVASEELASPVVLPGPPGRFAICLDPVDGSQNADVNGVVGTIFGIRPGAPAAADPVVGVLGPGTAQVAAGYVLFGPATLFVYTAGRGCTGSPSTRSSTSSG